MNKKLGLLFLSMILFLTSCKQSSSKNIEKPDLSFTTEEIALSFKSENYDIPDSLKVYFSDLKGKTVPFVSLQDLYAFLGTEIAKNEDIKSDVSFENGVFKIHLKSINEDTGEVEEGDVILDVNKNTLYATDISLIDVLVGSNAYSEDNFIGIAYEYVNIKNGKEVLINLSDYQIFMYENEGQIVVPFYFANFLFSGYDLELIYNFNGSESFIYSMSMDDLTDAELELDFIGDVNLTSEDIKLLSDETANYLSFIFDHFYGLRDVKKMNNFEKTINGEYNIGSSSNANELQGNFNRFILNLNDFHTSVYRQGFLNADYQIPQGVILKNEALVSFVQSMYSSSCDIEAMQDEESSSVVFYDIDPTTAYIEIVKQDGTIMDELAKVMPLVADKENIYFDIRCNGGGYMNDVNHILKYMSDNAWTIYNQDLYGGESKSVVTVEGDNKLDKNFFLVTGKPTFSSANLLASLVYENELATIVGEQSSGGACAVEITTTPDGASFSRSSASNCMVDSKGVTLENGVPVSKTIDFAKLQNSDYEMFIRKIVDSSK